MSLARKKENNFLNNLFLKLDENSILHLHLDSMLISLQLFVIFFVLNFKDKYIYIYIYIYIYLWSEILD